VHGLDLAAINPDVRPGDDFFQYANGRWLALTKIPPDRSSLGVFDQLTELTTKRLAELIRATLTASTPSARQIGDYYSAFMDEAAIERLGLQPLQPTLERIEAIGDRRQLARYLGSTLRADVDVLNNTELHTANFLGVWVAKSLTGPPRNLPFLLQGGLVMPDRDYYLDTGEHMAHVRQVYQQYVTELLRLGSTPDAEALAAKVLALEERIARTHESLTDSEDVLKGNNLWMRAEFAQRAPGLDWDDFFAGAGLAEQRQFVVWQPSAVTGMAALVGSEPLPTWKAWLRFHALDHAAPYLPHAFVALHFGFHEKELSGTPELPERWKRAVDATSAALRDAVGQLYVQRYFPPAEKAQVEALVHNLLAAFRTRIDRLQWMTPATRARAKEKLAALRVSIGYPQTWRSYAGLEVKPDEALANEERAELFEYRYRLGQLHRPVDRSEFVMPAQLVNAVNLPALVGLNFPAAILQPPFFDPQRPAVMNYGAIGAIIGHEISHSFDDQGALFDAEGQLHNWWTPQDFAHFRAAAAQLVQQFDHYQPLPGVFVHGQQTLSEDIADLAGLSAAYDAYRLALPGEAPAWHGLSGDKQFFLSFAQSWRQKVREARLRQSIITDGHAPAQYRADTVRNIDAWYGPFDVQPHQDLYLAPEARVRIW